MCLEFLSAERSVRYAPRQCQSNPSARVWLLRLGFPAGPCAPPPRDIDAANASRKIV